MITTDKFNVFKQYKKLEPNYWYKALHNTNDDKLDYDFWRWTPNNESTDSMVKFEVGEITLDDTIDQSESESITFENIYNNPVVVAYIKSRDNDESVDVRVKDVTSTGCTIFMEEPDNGAHSSGESVGYMVIEAGEWEFPDGTEIKAGTVSTDIDHYYGGSTTVGVQVSFDTAFSATPVILQKTA